MKNIQQDPDSTNKDTSAGAEQSGQITDPIPKDNPSAKPSVDVTVQIDAALAKQQTEFTAQLEQATGHKDINSLTEAHRKETGELQGLADGYKSKFEQAQINSAILIESSKAISPSFIKDFLSNKAECDENGNVTIDGKSVGEAVKTLLDANPFLAKPQGGPGSGAPQHSSAARQEMTRGEYDRLPQAERSEFIKGGGKVTD